MQCLVAFAFSQLQTALKANTLFCSCYKRPGGGVMGVLRRTRKVEGDYRRLLLGNCGGYLAIFTEGKGFGVGGEDLEADMVGAGGVMFVDTTHHGL